MTPINTTVLPHTREVLFARPRGQKDSVSAEVVRFLEAFDSTGDFETFVRKNPIKSFPASEGARMAINMPSSLKRRLEEVARKFDTTVSPLLGRLLDEYAMRLEKEKAESTVVSSAAQEAVVVPEVTPEVTPTPTATATFSPLNRLDLARFVFEAEGEALSVLDRGERGEHLYTPVKLAVLYQEGMVERFFPGAEPSPMRGNFELREVEVVRETPTPLPDFSALTALPEFEMAKLSERHSQGYLTQLETLCGEYAVALSPFDVWRAGETAQRLLPYLKLYQWRAKATLALTLLSADRGVLGDAEREVERLKVKTTELERDLGLAKSLNSVMPVALGTENHGKQLVALRERDAEITRLKAQITRLEQEKDQQTPEQIASRLQDHFKGKLIERFGIKINQAKLKSIQEEIRKRPTINHTHSGERVRVIEIEGHKVYAIIKDVDEEYTDILNTAYTEDMFRRTSFLD